MCSLIRGICLALAISSSFALAASFTATSEEYGDKWSFTVDKVDVLCVPGGYVLLDVNGQRYSLNGTAMSRFSGVYPTWREIAKPYPTLPGAQPDPTMKMGPPNDLLRRGKALCP
jgi:hypothetical protein